MQMQRLNNTDFDKMIIESIDEVYCFNKATDEILFYFDQIRSGEITSESEQVYAEGRQGVQLAAFDRNKTAGFTCENGYVQAGALAVQLGMDDGAPIAGETTFDVMEVIEAVTPSYTTTAYTEGADYAAGAYVTHGGHTYQAKAAITSAPAEFAPGSWEEVSTDTNITLSDTPTAITGVYLANSDGSKKERLASTAYALNGKVITGDGITASSKYIVHYTATTSNGLTIVNSSKKFSENVKLVINFVAQEPCNGSKYLMQCIMPNAKISGSFSLSAGDDPAVQNFEASALSDVCSDGELFTIKLV